MHGKLYTISLLFYLINFYKLQNNKLLTEKDVEGRGCGLFQYSYLPGGTEQPRKFPVGTVDLVTDSKPGLPTFKAEAITTTPRPSVWSRRKQDSC